MFKKIVDWISENQHMGAEEESFSKTTMEESEKSFDETVGSIKNDNCSSLSTEGTTCLLGGSLDDIQRCDKEINKSGIDVRQFDNQGGKSQIESKKPKSGSDQYFYERLSLIRNCAANFDPIADVVIKKDNSSLSTEYSESNFEPHLSSRKKISGFDRSLTLDNRRSKSSYIQNEVQVDKQYDKVMGKDSIRHCSVEALKNEEKSKSFLISELSLAHYTEKHKKSESSESLYGILFVVGFDKVVPDHLVKKMSNKYILRKRSKANGLVEDFSCVTSDLDSTLSTCSEKHVVLYSSSDANRSVVVAFKHDSLSDMFQIGRYDAHPVDFTVDDTNPSDKSRHGVSRFACRISVRRDQNHEARIYAGAFDSSRKICVGESSIAHDYSGKMDGFTTNGILIFKPGENNSGEWREISVSGYIYPLRSSSMDRSKRPRILDETNVLTDGTLIDLCGVTLIWRTPEGLETTPSEYYLSRFQSTLYKCVPECSLLSRDSNMVVSQVQRGVKKAYVYLSCGHVVGLSLLKPPDDRGKGWSCPTCRAIGPIKRFTLGTETGFYFDDELPSYAFKPCGHVASEKTVQFWSSIYIQNLRSNQYYCLCPFCGQKLNLITKYVKLNLPI